LALLGYVLGALLMLLYVLRLVVLDASNPVLLAVAALSGFVLNPAWYIWLGLLLPRRRQIADDGWQAVAMHDA
jgi:hypothetical protein